METIEDRCRRVACNELGCDPADVTRKASMFGDLAFMDSLDGVEFVMALEQEFEIQIPDEDCESIEQLERTTFGRCCGLHREAGVGIMKLILQNEDGSIVETFFNVETTGLVIVNNIGGVALNPEIRIRLAETLYPYWIAAQHKTAPKPAATSGNVTSFPRKP